MSSEPLITCVIPTYRRPRLLGRAIRSVLGQSFTRFKICVYDNASGDETGEVVEAIAAKDARVHYHCHRINIGSQPNFIYGLSGTDTPFVHLISDDDFLLPGFYMRAVEALLAHSEAAFFSGGLLSARPDGKVENFVRYGIGADQLCRPPSLFRLLASYPRTWTSALFRRASVERLGGLKKETSYNFDADLILRSAARDEAVLSDVPCAVFSWHPGSSSVSEASEAFESQLNLAYFRSVNEGIETALGQKSITDREAGAMKELIRAKTERDFFRGALAMIVRRNVSGARRASEILSQHFGRNDLATVIGAVTLNDGCGAFLRWGVRRGNVLRKAFYAARRAGKYTAYSEMVQNGPVRWLTGFEEMEGTR